MRRALTIAADYFVIAKPNRTQLATQAIRAANLTLELCQLVEGLNGIASRQWDTGNHVKLETQFSLETGQGANWLSLLGLMNNILNGTGDVTGATRRAQIQEFIDRQAGQ